MMKKQLTLLLAFTSLLLCSAPLKAEGNWYYDEATSKWRKNITPKFLMFNEITEAELHPYVLASPGGANPNPAITDSATLTEGYYLITGGQISATTTSASLRQGHVLVANPENPSEQVLRLASRNTTSIAGGILGVGGFLNLNWYLPSKFYRRGYIVESTFAIYDASNHAITLTVHGKEGVNDSPTTLGAAGWKTFTHTQTSAGVEPFRYKLSLLGVWGNNANNVAYFKTPVMEFVSADVPATRVVAVTTQGNGTVTPLHEKLYDQDVQQFTILPNTGETLMSAMYNGLDILSEIDENGVWYTPILAKNNTQLEVIFSTAISTNLSAPISDSWSTAVQGNNLTILNLQQGTPIFIYGGTGRLVTHLVAMSNQVAYTLSQGVYVVKSANKTVKVVVL